MNHLKAVVEHIAFTENAVKLFNFYIDNSKVQLYSKQEKLHIEIIGRKNMQKLQGLFFDIISLLFIYLGSVPKLCEIIENDLSINISQFSGKYTTSKYFYKNDSVICPINSETFNANTLKTFCKMNRTPINSLQFLLCKSYDKIAAAHRITLLLHVIDGVVSKQDMKNAKTELCKKYPLKYNIGSIGEYLPKVYHLCKNHFFIYHRKFNCGILKLLKITQLQFAQISTDTRHWYSHFSESKKKPNKLKNGDDMLIWFNILYYAIRLSVISSLNVHIDQNIIKEYYYILHDWILKVKYNREDNLKSNTYQINKSIKDLRNYYVSLQNK